jgi:hypothetical protein
MSQKILASHFEANARSDGLIEVRVDQVALAREPNRVIWQAVEAGLTRCVPEVNLAYPPHCVGIRQEDRDPHNPHRVPPNGDLMYDFTVDDPTAWTTRWSGRFTWRRSDDKVYEYACHEGNYAMGNILRGARLLEQEATAEHAEGR